MAGFSEWLFGSPDKLEKIATGTKQQQGLHNNIVGQAMNSYGEGGGANLANQYYNKFLGGNTQQAFNEFSQPYLQQFEEQILPQIAERFAGMGALSSSGFGQSLGGAASGLQANLAQLFSQLQSEAAGQQYNQTNQLSQQGLNYQPFAYNKKAGSSGFLSGALGAATSALGGPIGAAFGQGIAGGISNLFKPKAPAAAGGGGIT